MPATNNSLCQCRDCPGAGCNCGCQNQQVSQASGATCGCGPNCGCAERCNCKAASHG